MAGKEIGECIAGGNPPCPICPVVQGCPHGRKVTDKSQSTMRNAVGARKRRSLTAAEREAKRAAGRTGGIKSGKLRREKQAATDGD